MTSVSKYSADSPTCSVEEGDSVGNGRRWRWVERGRTRPLHPCPNRVNQEVQDRTPLRSEALADREHPLHEPRAPSARRPERGLAAHDCLPHGALGGVVRRLDALDAGEGPERRAVLAEILRDLAGGRDWVLDVALQESFEAGPNRCEPSPESVTYEFARAKAVPLRV
jgi:hypothetical protein